MSAVGDRERFERLYADAYSAVLGYCMRRLPPEAARDAAADVFTVAWRRLGDVPDPPLPWLLATASLTVRTAVRTNVRRDRLGARVAAAEPSGHQPDPADRVAQASRVHEALGRLGAHDREVLVLHAWDDLDAAAIAAVLGCSRRRAGPAAPRPAPSGRGSRRLPRRNGRPQCRRRACVY